jgi:hypothetical protein
MLGTQARRHPGTRRRTELPQRMILAHPLLRRNVAEDVTLLLTASLQKFAFFSSLLD